MSTKVSVTETAGPKVTVNEAGEVLVTLATGSVTVQGGLGDVVGPSATDNAIARFDTTTGKKIQNSGITIADGASGTLAGTNTGDQNIFQTIAVSGQSDVVADSTSDTLTLVAGANVSITTSAGSDSITISAAGSGDVVGPASSVNNRVVFFDGISGKLIKDSGLALSGSNTGDQTITLTSDVTGSGTGSFAATIANGAVTATKMATTLDLSSKTITVPSVVTADTGTNQLQVNGSGAVGMVQLGRDGGNNGRVGLWDEANAEFKYITQGDNELSFDTTVNANSFIGSGGGLADLNASNISTGTLALARGGTGASLADPNADRIMFWDDSAGQVTWLEAGSGLTISGTTISASGGVTDGDKGDITVSSGGATWTIDNQAVTLSKMQHISTASLLGRHASGTGDVQQIAIDGGLELNGANLRRAALTGDVTASAGSNSTTIANDAVTYAKMQNAVSSSRLLGSSSTGAGSNLQEIELGAGLSMSGSTLNASGTGDMTKAVYDQANTGFISGQAGVDDVAVGGTGGTLKLFGGDGGTVNPGNTGGPGGSVLLFGADGDTAFAGGAGGSISSVGYIGPFNGGSLVMDAGSSGGGGSITTSDGGGSINTLTGVIGLGPATDRTTISISSSQPRSISIPDNDGTFALTSDITGTNSGINTGDVTLAGTPDYITISGQTITRNAIDLTTDVTGTLPVANGGTGATTLTANAVLLGNGTSALQTVAPSTSGNVLTSNGTAWTSSAPATNPAGSGSELQFRSTGTAFGAVTGSTVSGSSVTLTGAIDAATLGSTLDKDLASPTYWQMHWDVAYAVSILSGSGAQSASGWSGAVRTGTTASSRATLYFGPTTDLFTGGPNQSRIVTDFSKRVSFGFAFSALSTTTNGQIFIRFSESAGTSGNLTNRGFGIRVNNTSLVAQCHNGTTLNTSATLKTIATGNVATWVVLQSDGAGNVGVWIDDVLATTMTGGPTTLATSFTTAAIETLNNADASETSLRVSPVKLITQP